MPILGEATKAGAKFAGYVVLRLPHGLKGLFQDWLQRWYPDRFDKVMNRIQAVRDGKLNNAEFGERMSGSGIFAEQIAAQFQIACRKAGILGNRAGLSAAHFRRPPRAGDQLDFGL
jgi:DNA repair photolyase